MKNSRKRILVIVSAMVATTLCGSVVGYQTGSWITLRLAEGKLRQYAVATITEADAASLESRAMLAQMHASADPFCSDAEIASFRNLIFLSEYLKEAGRIQDGKIACSAMLGRLAEPVALPAPDFSQADGIQVYTKLSPFRVGELSVVGLQQGDSYIVFSPYIEAHRAPVPIHSSMVAVDNSGKQGGQANRVVPQVKGSVLGGGVPSRQEKSIHATLCSERYPNCVTESESVQDAMQSGLPTLIGGAAVGGLVGLGLGFVFAFFYRRNQSLSRQIRKAALKGKIQVVYQSIVNPVSGGVTGAEALARWNDEEGALVEPEVFVKIAEDNGFVGLITKLVVRQVLKDFGEIMRNHPGFHVSVNITASDLIDESFMPMLEQELAKAEIRPHSLNLEILECCLEGSGTALQTIHELRQKGHKVLLDNFGSSYSNQSYVNAQSVDGIKIDKAFTQVIGTTAESALLLPKILTMAKSLKLMVIVEGIETARQASYYAATGFPILAQGWFFGYPVPAEVFRGWLHSVVKKEPQQAPADAA